MQGLRSRGEDETERIIKERRTVESGNFDRGAVSAFRGVGAVTDGDSDWKTLLAATEEFEVPVRLTSRLPAVLVLWMRGTRTERAAFIDVSAVVLIWKYQR